MEHIPSRESDSGLSNQEVLALYRIRKCSQQPDTGRYPESGECIPRPQAHAVYSKVNFNIILSDTVDKL
jgi:hypothetical protein